MSTLQHATLRDYINLIILSAIWGTAFIGIEIALEGFSVVQLTFGRVAVATLTLLPILFIKKITLPKTKIMWLYIGASALLNTALPFSLINYGQQFISAGQSALMIGFGPFFTLLLAHFMTNDEKFSLIKLISVLFGFFGLAILLGVNILNFNPAELKGQFAVLLASISYVLSSILLRHIKGVSFYHLSLIMFSISTIALLPLMLTTPLHLESISNKSLLALLYLGALPTAAASLYRIQMVQSVGVQFASQVAYLIPIFALIWAWLILGEIPKSSTYIALIFILIGMYLGKRK